MPGAAINRLAMTPDGASIYGVQTPGSPMRLFAIDPLLREIVATVVVKISPTDLLMTTPARASTC